MRRSFTIIALMAVLFGCEDEKLMDPLREITEEAYIIGVDPCSFPHGHSGTVDPLDGFVLRLVESNDTVVTYNLPEGIVKTVDNLENSYLFGQETRDSLKIILTYRQTPKEEGYYPICPANIYTGDFSRAVEDRQVVVINADRVD